MTPLRIGTRGSDLALWQARETVRLLSEVGIETTVEIIRTTGDRRTDVPLAAVGGKGMFIKELEEALVDDRIDLAVHSLKDVPSIIPEQFALVAFLERADPRDAWFHADGQPIESLGDGAVVGTGSPRRAAQLRRLHPRLEVRSIRGNVPTRIEKMKHGEFDGIVLASAGVNRLGRAGEITSLFPVDTMVPAAGQGIVAIEILTSRSDLHEALQRINHAPSALAARTERGVLQQFGTMLDCHSSIAVHAEISGTAMRLHAFASDPSGATAIRETIDGTVDSADELIRTLADELKDRGAIDLLTRPPGEAS